MSYDGANKTQLRQALSEFGLSPNKRLGQNFLCDANIADAIVYAAGDLCGKNVVEIGPGGGALTGRLLQRATHVTAIELDAGLCRLLNGRIDHENFTLIHGDALKVPFEEMDLSKGDTLVANLPYYVTTPLIMRFLTECKAVDRLVLMMQKEVAQRLCAPPGGREYGALSVAIQYYADVQNVLQVSSSCFYPAPDVASTVVRLDRHETSPKPRNEALLFEVVHACFAMRRKTIFNNLAAMPELGKQGAQTALDASEVNPSARGETLSLDDFIKLSDAVGAVLVEHGATCLKIKKV